MGTIVTILSGKGGVGKTTITALVGAALAKQGHKVLITDADMGMRDLDLVIGRENDILYNVVDVQRDKENLEHALVSVSSNLDFLAASQEESWQDVKRKKYAKLMRKLAKTYDYILIDGPAGLGRGVDTLVELADRVVVVTQPKWVALRNAGRIFQLLRDQRKFDAVVVFNEMKADLGQDFSIPAMTYQVGAEYVGAILPHSEALAKASQDGLLPLFYDVRVSAQLELLVTYVATGQAGDDMEMDQAFQDTFGPSKGLWSRIKRAFSK